MYTYEEHQLVDRETVRFNEADREFVCLKNT